MDRQQGAQFINQGVPAVWSVGTVLLPAICGTGSDAILAFTNVAVNGAGIADASSAVLGTVINITRAGIYHCSLTYATTAGGTINHLAITLNTDAAGLTGLVAMATVGRGDYATTLAPAGTNASTKLTFVATVTRALAQQAGGSNIRFHATDHLGATPAGGDVTEAECRFNIHLIGNVL